MRKMSNQYRALLAPVMALTALLLLTAGQTACAKKAKVALEDAGPVKVVILPFAVSAEKSGEEKDLQWMALGAPALLAKTSRRFADIEIIPLWEVMPTAISAAGATRSFNDENAGSLAGWVSADWAVMGEIRKIKGTSYSVILDFIPAKPTNVPFRYIKTRRINNIGNTFQAGLLQWLRYATGKQILTPRNRQPGLQTMRALGEALDREYGWLVEAAPGDAQEMVTNALGEDEVWTRIMFSPTLYPALAPKP